MEIVNIRTPISVLVVGYNEGHLLKECLESVQFCDEILYFDLGSEDGSVKIAVDLASSVKQIDWSPIVEPVHQRMIAQTKHDWVMLLDPDERISNGLQSLIRKLLEEDIQDKKIGAFSFPWRFFFGKRELKGTVWGFQNRKILLVHKDCFELSGEVHSGRAIKTGYQIQMAGDFSKEYGDHYWVSGWEELVNKHKRYLSQEGQTRYDAGSRPTRLTLLITPFRKFKYCFISKKGYQDGWLGFLLSLFYAWYECQSLHQVRLFIQRTK